jgi:hypothetical protein
MSSTGEFEQRQQGRNSGQHRLCNALSYMPVDDNVNYMAVLRQMYNALYDLNVEADLVRARDPNLSRYKVLLIPPL